MLLVLRIRRIWLARLKNNRGINTAPATRRVTLWAAATSHHAKHYQVTVMDSRGHGRSTCNRRAFSHHLMASDVIGLMDFLMIGKAAMIGWSDGADIGLDIAINCPDRMRKLFAFAGDINPTGVTDLSKSEIFNAYVARTKTEYKKLSSTPGEYHALLDQINKMWMSRPNLGAEQLRSIKVPVWVVDADHEEAVKRENTLFIFDNIPGSALLIQAAVSHFSFLQDPQVFNDDILHFLNRVR
jgi:pimeloyl-ACP methyl ester carboxylesterase